MARPAGSVATFDNTEVKNMLNELDCFNYNELPRWMDDCISGATTQVVGTQRFSPAALYNLLRSLDTVSSVTVAEALNRKREALGDAPVSTRYAQYVTKAIRTASGALSHHANHVINTL